MIRVLRSVCSVLLLLLVAVGARADDFEFHAPALASDAAMATAIRDLAVRVLPVYQEDDQDRYLANLWLLQVAAGDYGAAAESRQRLLDRRRTTAAADVAGRRAVLDLYTRARAAEQDAHVPFPQAFADAYNAVVPKLDDADAYALTTLLAMPPSVAQESAQKTLDYYRPKQTLSLGEALSLISNYLPFEAHKSIAPLAEALNTEDDLHRYVTQERIPIEVAKGVTLSATVVRPKSATQPLPTLFELAIEPSVNYARESAAHGYAGVVVYARGTNGSTGRVAPFQHEGADAISIIGWIGKQSFSDGRVGMYGSGYSGFAVWATARDAPAALKAIATSDAMAPGIHFPMTGNIFRNSAYRWAFEVTKAGGAAGAGNDATWRALDEAWYRSGESYRAFTGPHGKRAKLFSEWLDHPSYDSYWRKLVPFREEYSKIEIPVLTMTGYYADGESGALYYYREHTRYNEHANHTLLIGPYDDAALRRGPLPAAILQGLPIDEAAHVNLRELRYQWFDSIFKGGTKPALLSDPVNYQIGATNEWRHAASLDALAKQTQRYFLAPGESGGRQLLALEPPAAKAEVSQSVAFTDRSDAQWRPTSDLVTRVLETHNSVAFVSEPLQKPQELAGAVSGALEFTVNKLDADFVLSLYELQMNGEYVKLFDPEFSFRASYSRDRSARHLLQAGVRQQLSFQSERLSGRRLASGSRVVLVLGINKRADQQINYGNGDDVSEESLPDDGQIPLRIRWHSGSYIDLPVQR